ncbi:hypothetical protein V6N13_098518 [Hibiscus sabdariffa]|uniref:Uncharacterized protein n=1 Tax=Hibiscus sabdariffa TaxID=183260 RepID=A0ABR2EEH3_9ROSI
MWHWHMFHFNHAATLIFESTLRFESQLKNHQDGLNPGMAVNLAEEMGKVGSNSSPSFAAILPLALQKEYQDSTEKMAIRSHIS